MYPNIPCSPFPHSLPGPFTLSLESLGPALPRPGVFHPLRDLARPIFHARRRVAEPVPQRLPRRPGRAGDRIADAPA